jgi:FKBP-type peptidyl-prolyl cis-trans isomerase
MRVMRMHARYLGAALALALLAGAQGCFRNTLDTGTKRTSYAMGLDIGAGMHMMKARLDLSALTQGISDTMQGETLLVATDSLEPLRRQFARHAFERRNDSAAGAKAEPGPGRVTLVRRRALETETEKMCYAVGVDIGSKLRGTDVMLDLTALAQGIADTVFGQRVRLKAKESAKLLAELADTISVRRRRADEKHAETMAAESEKFLSENGSRAGVRTTKSGLQYEVVKKGKGRAPGPKARVRVHYTIRLAAGTEIESSREFVEPATWVVDGVNAGLSEGLQLMAPGAIYRFYVPPSLAYGAHARGKVPANAVVVAEVELMEVEK